jgi:hypothetical protein
MHRLQDLFRNLQGGQVPATDGPVVDTSEKVRRKRHFFAMGAARLESPSLVQVHISSLALLKMLKHGRAGVPMEVRTRTHHVFMSAPHAPL